MALLEPHPALGPRHGLWQRQFGGDHAIVNRTGRINGEAWMVMGVMPEDFVFPAGTQLWVPLALSPAEAVDRATRNLFVMGRPATAYFTLNPPRRFSARARARSSSCCSARWRSRC